MAAPLNTCTTIEQRDVVCFCGQKLLKQRISTKKCCSCTVNIACHVKQSSKTRSFGGTLSWRWCGWKSSARGVPTATKRILRRRFPGTCETVGQVIKFVWRLCWKINVVCMSLSPFDSIQSRFVTYLLNRPRKYLPRHRRRLVENTEKCCQGMGYEWFEMIHSRIKWRSFQGRI